MNDYISPEAHAGIYKLKCIAIDTNWYLINQTSKDKNERKKLLCIVAKSFKKNVSRH